MIALGLQGSPNLKGSTVYLLDRFMNELAARGVRVHTIQVARKNILPCRGCGYCEKKGVCVIADDDMAAEIYALLRQAEIVIAASPIFFYSLTSQLKALIDRTQALWSRKYRFHLADPLKNTRRGFLLSLAGSRGKQLFEGAHLVAKYFFDAVDAEFAGSLTYRSIETRQDILERDGLADDIARAVDTLLAPLRHREKAVFAGRGNACRSQMAAAFAQHAAAGSWDIVSAGTRPLPAIDPVMVRVMAQKGLDVAFQSPTPLGPTLAQHPPHRLIAMDANSMPSASNRLNTENWELPDVVGKPDAEVQAMADRIEKRVDAWLAEERPTSS